MRLNNVAARHIATTQFDVRLWACGTWVTLQCDASQLPQTWPSDLASESERQFMPSERQTDFGAAYGSSCSSALVDFHDRFTNSWLALILFYYTYFYNKFHINALFCILRTRNMFAFILYSNYNV